MILQLGNVIACVKKKKKKVCNLQGGRAYVASHTLIHLKELIQMHMQPRAQTENEFRWAWRETHMFVS